jgi:NAD(P)-dependent dehydrogenase (short-subunit alcohol dehydrogenase family)
MGNGDVADRAIIVTGGGGGIGRGLVRHLGSAGAKVVIAEINQDNLDVAVKDLEAMGAECLGVPTDIMERSSIQTMVDATVNRFGRVDGLVNNALVSTGQVGLAELSEAEMDSNIRSHVKATLWGMQAVYPHMKRAGWGRIVNVGSSAGLVGFKGFGAYGAAKEAVRSLTRTAAREWAVDGIVVNCYCPVSMRHHQGQWEPDSYVGESMAVLASLLPAGQAENVGDPERDLGPTVAFLLSDACRYLTGQTLTLDGGSYAFA